MRLNIIFLIFSLLSAGNVFAASVVIKNDLPTVQLSSRVEVPLPPGEWDIKWKGDIDFCSPEDKLRCVGTDGRALVLNNLNHINSPFHAVIIRYSNQSVRNWNMRHCYSKAGFTYFDSHETTENMILNKCSWGEFRLGGTPFQMWHWWWDAIKSGTDQLPVPLEDNIRFEIVLQENGRPRYQIDLLVKKSLNGTTFTNEQLMEWKARYVDFLSHKLFRKKLTLQSAGLVLTSKDTVDERSDLVKNDVSNNKNKNLTNQEIEDNVSGDEGEIVKPDFFNDEAWTSPVEVGNELVYTPIKSLFEDDSHFLVQELTPIVSPAEGKIVFLGSIDDELSGFVIDHGFNVFSIISSNMPWNLRQGVTLGDTVERGQFLISGSLYPDKKESIVSWRLVRSTEKPNLIDSAWVKSLFQAPSISTRFISNLGSVRIYKGQLPKGAELKINGELLRVDLLDENALLLPVGYWPFNFTYGGFFKKNTESIVVSTVDHTVVKYFIKSSNGDIVVNDRLDRSLKLGSSKMIFAELNEGRDILESSNDTPNTQNTPPAKLGSLKSSEPTADIKSNSSSQFNNDNKKTSISNSPLQQKIQNNRDESGSSEGRLAGKPSINQTQSEKNQAEKEAAKRSEQLLLEQKNTEKAKLAAARENIEKAAAERAAKVQADKLAAEKAKAEKIRLEKEKSEKMAAEKAAKIQADKLAAEKVKAEKIRLEKEKSEKMAAEKAAKIQADKLVVEKAKADKLIADKVRADRIQAEKIKSDKEAADKLKAEQLAAEKLKIKNKLDQLDLNIKNPKPTKKSEPDDLGDWLQKKPSKQ